MLDSLTLTIVVQRLALLWLAPPCEASSLGLTVHVVPLQSDGGQSVRAHFTVIASNPCPPLTGLCTEGDNCILHKASSPFSGAKPNSGWCVRQWEQVVPSNYNSTISLSSSTTFYVSVKAEPHIRANSGKLNQPAFVALPPPIRTRENCPHHIQLSVKDPDGDRVRCRFAVEEQGECLNCTPHAFIELNEDACALTFAENAPVGQYSIYMMAEDFIPTPKVSQTSERHPLSSVPVHLSLTVEPSSSSCTHDHVATGKTPRKDATFNVLPFEDVKFAAEFMSQRESVSEIAVVGQPGLIVYGFTSIGAMSQIFMSWVRGENSLSHLLPICFVANSMSLQSEPHCVWLYQREMRTLPDGTELICNKTEMTLVLPVASLSNINLTELQLNSPACPVIFNDTHLTARIALDGCGTKTVHAGTELVYTNTLKSVRPSSIISRRPSLILPLACRIPAVQARGPNFNIAVSTTVFDDADVRLEFHLPGEGPLAIYTNHPQFKHLGLLPGQMRRDSAPVRHIRAFQAQLGSRIKELDLHLLSNTTLERAELNIKRCVQSGTDDFAESSIILENGCKASSTTKEIRATSHARIFRLDLSDLVAVQNMLYVKCELDLCISSLPSQKCARQCNQGLLNRASVEILSKNFTVKSGPVSLVVTTPAPSLSVATGTSAAAEVTSTSSAPGQVYFMAVGLILNIFCIYLQYTLIH
ncbi:transaldolase isoform X1 [Syngnathus typhle]|uniref:transaldolase isoform X1 n=1 Tax=Syngnathus typhle TaxID=161592 RepID=UPI002A6A6A0C|nr:transaldolase isoform X1 [Syngnathus typhle]XP_061132976.1 transaldolase isoform X1 [Syngnathus typhle]